MTDSLSDLLDLLPPERRADLGEAPDAFALADALCDWVPQFGTGFAVARRGPARGYVAEVTQSPNGSLYFWRPTRPTASDALLDALRRRAAEMPTVLKRAAEVAEVSRRSDVALSCLERACAALSLSLPLGSALLNLAGALGATPRIVHADVVKAPHATRLDQALTMSKYETPDAKLLSDCRLTYGQVRKLAKLGHVTLDVTSPPGSTSSFRSRRSSTAIAIAPAALVVLRSEGLLISEVDEAATNSAKGSDVDLF